MSFLNFEDMLEPEESDSIVIPRVDLVEIHNDLVKAVLVMAKTCDENGFIGKRGLTRKETKDMYKLINPILQHIQDVILDEVQVNETMAQWQNGRRT